MICARLLVYSSSLSAPESCSAFNSCNRSPTEAAGGLAIAPAPTPAARLLLGGRAGYHRLNLLTYNRV